MANRPICKPYFIDTHDLLEWNIPGAKRIHSSSLMHINYAAAEETIFPELVREFWGGARFDETCTLKGQVLDYDLSFDIDRISDLLQIPTGGEIYDKDWKRGKDMDDIRQTVYGAQEISNANATRVIYLTPAASLVFLMAVNVFCPRVSQHNYITDLDVFIIYHILKKIKLDPVNLVHQHLRRVQANNSMGIPYGFLITLYLRYMEPMRFAGWNQFARQEARQMSSAFLECRGVGTEERPESERDGDDDDGAPWQVPIWYRLRCLISRRRHLLSSAAAAATHYDRLGLACCDMERNRGFRELPCLLHVRRSSILSFLNFETLV